MSTFLSYLLARAKEPSTYAGFGVIGAAVAVAVSTPSPATVVAAGVAVLGGVAAVLRAEGNTKAAAEVLEVAEVASKVVAAVGVKA